MRLMFSVLAMLCIGSASLAGETIITTTVTKTTSCGCSVSTGGCQCATVTMTDSCGNCFTRYTVYGPLGGFRGYVWIKDQPAPKPIPKKS